MAHFRRAKPRLRTRAGYSRGAWKRRYAGEDYGSWTSHWPAWWDRQFHTRPRRRMTQQLLVQVSRGRDADEIAWPLDKKPHTYYW